MAARDLAGHRVLGPGAEDVARPERDHEPLRPGEMGGVVHRRVSEVHGERMGAMVGPDSPQPGSDVVERFVPRHRLELAGAADPAQRSGHPIRVVHDATDGGALGAQVTLRHRVLTITFDRHDPPAVDLDGKTAQRLTDPAVREVGLGHVAP